MGVIPNPGRQANEGLDHFIYCVSQIWGFDGVGLLILAALKGGAASHFIHGRQGFADQLASQALHLKGFNHGAGLRGHLRTIDIHFFLLSRPWEGNDALVLIDKVG